MSYLYKKAHRIFKPVEITIRRGLSSKGEKWWDEVLWVINHTFIEMS
jgi:hypothetical protein